MAQVSAKKQDALITKIYGQYCSGMRLRMQRIPELFRIARAMLNDGQSEAMIGLMMIEFIQREAVS